MSPQLLGMNGEGQGNVGLMASSTSHDCKSRNFLGLKEHSYLGLSASSSINGPVMKILIEESKGGLNLKATELRLGLPGSESPKREKKLNLEILEPPDEKQLFSLLLSKDGIYSSATRNVVSRNKRVFSGTIKEFSPVKSETDVTLSNMSSETLPNIKSECLSKASIEQSSAPPAKTQVVGWPPVRSFRKNTLATTSKNIDEGDGKRSPGAFFVKVSMDGAPYLRKVDLRSYSTYQELSLALEKMFSCFTFGNADVNEGPGSESKLRASLRGSDYVLTFEDKDGDWMLVGDVPWGMFIESCKRLKIMKGSDAIGLASRAIKEKVKD